VHASLEDLALQLIEHELEHTQAEVRAVNGCLTRRMGNTAVIRMG
jgi:hypothetical protein